jgi:hypothetical protein
VPCLSSCMTFATFFEAAALYFFAMIPPARVTGVNAGCNDQFSGRRARGKPGSSRLDVVHPDVHASDDSGIVGVR